VKTYTVEHIRNVGLFSHGGAGKTSLAEAGLFASGAINRLGRVDDGNTTSDWDPDEIKRGMSISTSIIPIEWRDHKINLIDAPGYADFVGEMLSAMRVCDAALILMDASAGVEVGTEQAWRFADKYQRPRAMLVNKMDRENADFDKTLQQAQEHFGDIIVPAFVPIGAERDFRGIVDVLANIAYSFPEDQNGEYTEIEIPADLADQVEEYRTQLIERICEVDEELTLRYLEDDEITVDELRTAMCQAFISRNLVPVLAGAATSCRGTKLILDTIVDCFPPPSAEEAMKPDDDVVELNPAPDGPVAALIFKTVADPFVGKISYFRVFSGTVRSDSHLQVVQKKENERLGQLHVMRGKEQIAVSEITAGDIGAVTKLDSATTGDTLCDAKHLYTLTDIDFPDPAHHAAVFPHTKGDLDKMGTSIQRLIEEDPTLRVWRDPDTHETIVAGLGESHVQIALQRMGRKFGVNVDIDLPKIPYRETITSPAKGIEYKHKKQTGGHGQYGHVYLDIEPYPDGDFLFEDTIVGGVVPKNFIPAVEKGLKEALDQGILAGYPVMNVKVTLTDGSYHSVDSSEMAFKIAAQQAFRKGVAQANPTLMEPVMKMRITVPENYVGDIMSDLNGKRGQVQGMDPRSSGFTTIEAFSPAAEIQRYASDLRSMSQGRGYFSVEFSHYAPVPPHLTDSVIETAKVREAAHA
jgi:elongation factor G